MKNVGVAKGKYIVECYDKSGKLKWKDHAENKIVNEGLDLILTTMFQSDSQVGTWYIGLKGTGTVAAADTLASHSGWTENTAYSGDRKEWVDGTVSSQSLSNTASKAEFTMTSDSQTIAGAFLCSVSTGTSGSLYSAADFSGGNKTLDTDDVLRVEYTVTMSSTT
jgi:hypothetical protein